jgi:hypothetical protein
MPSYTGTSVLGLQKVGFSVFPDDGTAIVVFSGANQPDRLERVGTLLICQDIGAPLKSRTIAVHKLYGHGLLTQPMPVVAKFSMVVHYWVIWFRPGLGWNCQTF